ncbi:glycosyl hydrolase [Histomonas meleagridis]|uniref:glycosyl hydrolase n=1 Tax=Histomonas meleagridis TaxID=135588 RepID=UPI00355A4904|nr:glycosyl hydrolase [Histomonas meleagridis]KAH0800577.1 glycosyl hydrolase [Histomonas meleagridis]
MTANHITYRKCKDSLSCGRNRFVEEQKWSAISLESKIENNIFTIPIVNTRFKNRLMLLVTFHPGFVHFKVIPPSESFQRYDCSSEPTIIDQDILRDHLEIEGRKSETHITLINSHTKVEIQFDPFSILIYDHNTLKLTASYDDKSIFETNVSPKEFPDLFNPVEFQNYTETLKNGPTSVAMSFKFHENVCFSGLATHTLSLAIPSTVKNGKAVTDPIRFFNTDINRFDVDSVMSMYGSIPFLIGHIAQLSTGLFWCNPSETWVDIDSEDHSSRFISESGFIDFFVFTGTHKEVISSYASITGKLPMPQLFSLGYHQSRWTYSTSNEVRAVTKSLDKAMIPHESIWLDLDHTDDKKFFTFDPNGFNDIDKLAKEFSQSHRYLITLVDPHLKIDERYRIYSEAKNNDLLLKNRDNKDYVSDCWPGKSVWVDFLNPLAREWWSEQFKYQKYKGSSENIFIWNDMNEPAVFNSPDSTIPRDTLHYNGHEDREVHNLYGHFMVLSTYDGLLRRNNDQNERPFILTRSYFSGTQKYSFVWTGDNTSNWEHLENSISQVISLNICGYSLCGCDVGGFFDSPNNELLARWYQLGAYCYPFFRCHCHHLSERREPYNVTDDKWFEAIKIAIEERYQLMYLWYTAAYHSYVKGSPIITPLWYSFNDVNEIDNQFMIDETLMVIPITKENVNNIPVSLPLGHRWYELRALTEYKPLNHFGYDKNIELYTPVFIWGGHIFGLKSAVRKNTFEMMNDPFEVIVALDVNYEAIGEIYVDDGHTFNFEKNNEFVLLKMEFERNSLKFEVDEKCNRNSEFFRNFVTKIEKVKIVGIDNMPKNIKCSKEETEIQFEDVNGVLVIDVILEMKENCTLTFEF